MAARHPPIRFPATPGVGYKTVHPLTRGMLNGGHYLLVVQSTDITCYGAPHE